jgi:hypothetical protein
MPGAWGGFVGAEDGTAVGDVPPPPASMGDGQFEKNNEIMIMNKAEMILGYRTKNLLLCEKKPE